MVSDYDLRRVRRLAHGETLTLPRQAWVRVPPGFRRSRLSARPRVEGVYREDRPTGPVVLRVESDRVVARRDRYHPGYHPVKHALRDLAGLPVRERRGDPEVPLAEDS